MANIPVIRSREQIFGDLIDGILSRIKNINDLNQDAVLVQFTDALSQSNFRASASLIQMIDAQSIDRATGEALKRLARDRNVPILTGTASSGPVSITDLTFQKIYTTIYAGQPAPVPGSQTIYVASAVAFPATGSIYLGRGTANSEGPLQYTAVAVQGGGSYWAITLSATNLTTNFHNIGETIILAQGGNRTIPVNATTSTAQGSNVTSISFKTTSQAIIQDGEVTVTGVPVICNNIGTIGNVPAGAISQATGLQFTASVTNTQPFSNGLPPDDDDTLRQRIKDYEQAKSNGTDIALETAAIGVTSTDDLKTVQSADVYEYANGDSALVFDDGSGYEPIFTGVGLETIVDVALGGEIDVQLRNVAICQVQIVNNVPGPYNILNNTGLQVNVEGTTLTHTFLSTDFAVPGAGTALEVAVSINTDPNFHCYARTANGGSNVVIYPRDNTKNVMTVIPLTSNDANTVLGFGTTANYTILLYQNNEPLYEDGLVASVSTLANSLWSSSIVGPTETLQYQVDNTPVITASFTTANFQAVSPTAILSASTDITIWAQVMTNVMPGVTATVNGNQIVLSSNLGENNNAAINIVGGTLLDKMFSPGLVIESFGRASDYTFNRNTGQIALANALNTGDSLTSGSPLTNANMITSSIPDGPSQSGNIWMVVDGDVEVIPNGLQSNTSVGYVNVSSNLFNIVGTSITSSPQGFEQVEVGDWILIWTQTGDNISYPSLYNHAGFWRVQAVQEGQITVDVGNNSGYVNGTDPGIPVNRIAIVRTQAPMQVFSFTLNDLDTFATLFQEAIDGIQANIVGSAIRISTLSDNSSGQLYIAAADTGGQTLNLPVGTIVNSVTSQLGYVVDSDSEAGIPSFTVSTFTTIINDELYTDPNYLNDGGTYDNFAEILNRYDTTDLLILSDSNKYRRALTISYDQTNQQVGLLVPPYMLDGATPIKANDRYFLRSSYQFDSLDTVTVVIDQNLSTQSYAVPVSRRLQINSNSTPTIQSFSASDIQSSLALSDPNSFYDFDFSNFKAWRQANTTLTNGTYSITFTAADFGPSGNSQRVGFVYPSSLSQTSLSLNIGNSDMIDIGIVLPVKTPRTPNWDGSTSFTAAVTTTGGLDTITYTYQVGTQPNFVSAGVVAGDLCLINPLANFLQADAGLQALVSGVTATSFSLQLPTGLVQTDDVQFSSMTNLNGTVSVTSATPHNISAGERIGFYDTASPNGSSYPFNTTYYPTITGTSSFTVPTPSGVPGGAIAAGTFVNGVVTITSNNHGLSVGNIVLISGVPTTQYNGTYAVSAVLNANQFQYISSGSQPAIASGRFDFQSYTPNAATVVNITTLSQTGYTVTVTTTGGTFVANQLVQIQGTSIDAWNIGNTYNVGDIVSYGSLTYVSLIASNTGNEPDTSPTDWAVTTNSFNGTVTVQTGGSGTFTYLQGFSSNMTGSGGTATLVESSGALARSIGSMASLLSFAAIGTTAQAVADYLTSTQPGIISAISTTPTASIATSTADTGISGNYLSGTVNNIATVEGSRLITLTAQANVPAGSTINLASAGSYNGTYVIRQSVSSGSNYLLTAQSGIFAVATANNSVSATYTGYQGYAALQDGENWIMSSDLQATSPVPQFLAKQPWNSVPALGEEIRLVAITSDHLTRFWNELVATGLSNVSTIENSEYGRDLQITTNTLGASGSVYVAGGTANAGNVALVGSASQYGTTAGIMTIPYAARTGLNARFWLNVNQTVTQDKLTGFDSSTQLTVLTNGIQITGGDGSFQTQRSTTQNSTTIIGVENHGSFLAFITQAGTSMGLMSNPTPVQEGDWVKIRNVSTGVAWNALTAYTTGQKIDYTDGYSYVALANSTNVIPGSNSAIWRRLGFNFANQGIFLVVRVFGNDAFWVVPTNPVEEIVQLNTGAELQFFSYDSIMPGDTLVISGTILGSQNVGQFTVLDELSGPPGTLFPTATRIYTQPIPQVSSGGITLGQYYSQVSILEAKPISLWKRIISVGPGSSNYATVVVDSPNLMNKVSSSLGAYMTFQGKIGYDTNINYGVNSYSYFNGLIEELNKVIYGDPTDPIDYPGVRAAGSFLDIIPAIVIPIKVSVAVRLRSGINFNDLVNRIKAAIAGYVNTLGVGEPVSLTSVETAGLSVDGVLSCVLTSPLYNASNDLINIGSNQRAEIISPTTDVTVSVIGS